MRDLTQTALTAEAAGRLVDDIRSSFETAWQSYADGCQQLVTAYKGRAWESLGLADWDAFVSHTLDVDHVKIPKAERAAIVAALKAGGLTVRAIVAATGLSIGTVQRALGPPGVPNGTRVEPLRSANLLLHHAIDLLDEMTDISVLESTVVIARQCEAEARKLVAEADRHLSALEARTPAVTPAEARSITDEIKAHIRIVEDMLARHLPNEDDAHELALEVLFKFDGDVEAWARATGRLQGT